MAQAQQAVYAATAAKKATRPNKSHKLINELKHLSANEVAIPNPFAKLMEKTAKHIEWLELLVTGITGRERQTIAKLTRRVATLETMVAKRDNKNEEMVRDRKQAKKDFAKEKKEAIEMFEREYDHIKKRKLEILPKIREQIEREFIARMQTTKDNNDSESARQMLERQLRAHVDRSGGWHQVTTSGTSNY